MNHPRAEVIQYSPREMHAFITLARRRERRQDRRLLAIQANAYRASQEDLRRLLRDADD